MVSGRAAGEPLLCGGSGADQSSGRRVLRAGAARDLCRSHENRLPRTDAIITRVGASQLNEFPVRWLEHFPVSRQRTIICRVALSPHCLCTSTTYIIVHTVRALRTLSISTLGYHEYHGVPCTLPFQTNLRRSCRASAASPASRPDSTTSFATSSELSAPPSASSTLSAMASSIV